MKKWQLSGEPQTVRNKDPVINARLIELQEAKATWNRVNKNRMTTTVPCSNYIKSKLLT